MINDKHHKAKLSEAVKEHNIAKTPYATITKSQSVKENTAKSSLEPTLEPPIASNNNENCKGSYSTLV